MPNNDREGLYRAFEEQYPLKITRRLTGLESEFPLVKPDGTAVDYSIVKDLFQFLSKKGFKISKDTGTGEPVEAKGKKGTRFSGDVVSTDVGYATIELAMAPEADLSRIERRFNRLLKLVVGFLKENDSLMLGYGIQPVTPPQKSLLAPKGRYIFFEQDSLNTFVKTKDGVDLHVFAVTAANQVHVEVSRDEALRVFKVLNELAGLQMALSANSPVWGGKADRICKAARELFWEMGWSNRVEQTGIPKPMDSFACYVDHLGSFRPLMVKRGKQFIKIIGRRTFMDFMLNEKSRGETVQGKKVWLRPKVDDLFFHSGFAWHCARLSPGYGTVEARVFCQQPPGETMVVPALVLGLVENLEEAEKLADELPWNAWRHVRSRGARKALEAKVMGRSIIPLVRKMLDISRRGLMRRGLGEERYLETLYRRLKDRRSPADNVRVIFKSAGIKGLLREYSFS